MKLLLDTHTFLWFINNDSKLSPSAKTLLESDVDLLLSVASLWEIVIKFSIGKLSLPDSFDKFIPTQLALNDIEILEISLQHLSVLSTLPFHHKDPFDRLLVAQAIVEDISLVSCDATLDDYTINRMW